jgi:hypothetical protein
MRAGSSQNEYQKKLGWMFDEIPKTVLAAIAVSLTVNSAEGGPEDVAAACQDWLAHEWEVLHLNGIVPQKPTGKTTLEALKRVRSRACLRGGK